jgi:parallel beta-helix repeat protein
VFPIVDVKPGSTGNLKNLVINGSLAESQFNSCADDYVGVFYSDSSGALQNVHVNNIELPTSPVNLFGCQDGQGVYAISSATGSSTVTASGVHISAFQKNGFTCHDPNTSCSIMNSNVSGIGPNASIAQNGIEMLNTAGAQITGDTVTGDSYTGGGLGNSASGLLLFNVGTLTVASNTVSSNDVNVYLASDGTGPAAGGWSIRSNHILNASDNVPGGEQFYGDGIELDSTTNPVTIVDNTITGSAEDGISVLGASHAFLNTNSVSGSHGNGIELGANGSFTTAGATDNLVEHNTTRNGGGDGIVADASTSANTMRSNTSSSNMMFDLEDLGTGNTWISNLCVPAHDSNPAGLC